ncbi:MAG: RDD family protein, partial [Thermoplasmata archaeon]|nr:RDD family protein [Thermoplasmata archaeon]
PSESAEKMTSGALLRRSLVAAVEGRIGPSIRDAEGAVEAALRQSHSLLMAERGTTGGDASPWLGAPAWLEADRTNLAALARRTEFHPADATRAWMTARWIVRFARSASRRCFASVYARGVAFLIDLALLTAPAVLLWYYVVATTTGSLSDLLGSIPVNAALFAFTSLGLVYFVLAESFFATTVGKMIVGLRVRSRELTPPGPLAVLVRSLPKLAPLTIVGVFLILAIILAVRGSTVSVSLPGGVGVSVNAVLPVIGYLAAALAVVGGISALVMHYTPERQRVGDVLADTWVVRTPPTAPSAARAPPATAPFG